MNSRAFEGVEQFKKNEGDPHTFVSQMQVRRIRRWQFKIASKPTDTLS